MAITVTKLQVLFGANPDVALAVDDQTSIAYLVTLAASAYPATSTPLSASSGIVANNPASASLVGAAGKTTYITGFEVTGTGATNALPVTVTVGNVAGGNLSYSYAAVGDPLAANVPLIVPFNPPLPASGPNVTITVSCQKLDGGNIQNSINVHGFRV